jgi:hypothetical protein
MAPATETEAFNFALQRLLTCPPSAQPHSSSAAALDTLDTTAATANPAQLSAIHATIVQLAAQAKALEHAAHATRCDLAGSRPLCQAVEDDNDKLSMLESAVQESATVLESQLSDSPWSHTSGDIDVLAAVGEKLDRMAAQISAAKSLAEYRDTLLGFREVSIPFSHFRDGGSEQDGNKAIDTTHQDTRDIERDMLCVNGQVCIGSKLKYQRVVTHMRDALAAAQAHVIGNGTNGGSSRDAEGCTGLSEAQQNALDRYSRVILNVGNRTNSGGNAFEVIHLALIPRDLEVLITPDSEAASPIQVHIDAGPFYSTNPKHSGEEMEGGSGEAEGGWHWGIRATIIGETSYFITNALLGHRREANDGTGDSSTDMHLVKVKAKYMQHLAMRWPPPEYASEETVDDGKSEFNRQWYTLGGHRFEGDVVLSVLPCDEDHAIAEEDSDSVVVVEHTDLDVAASRPHTQATTGINTTSSVRVESSNGRVFVDEGDDSTDSERSCQQTSIGNMVSPTLGIITVSTGNDDAVCEPCDEQETNSSSMDGEAERNARSTGDPDVSLDEAAFVRRSQETDAAEVEMAQHDDSVIDNPGSEVGADEHGWSDGDEDLGELASEPSQSGDALTGAPPPLNDESQNIATNQLDSLVTKAGSDEGDAVECSSAAGNWDDEDDEELLFSDVDSDGPPSRSSDRNNSNVNHTSLNSLSDSYHPDTDDEAPSPLGSLGSSITSPPQDPPSTPAHAGICVSGETLNRQDDGGDGVATEDDDESDWLR